MAKSVLILDATFSEESCSPASMTIAVSRDSNSGDSSSAQGTDGDTSEPYKVCGIYKNGSGSFMPEELLIAVNVSCQMLPNIYRYVPSLFSLQHLCCCLLHCCSLSMPAWQERLSVPTWTRCTRRRWRRTRSTPTTRP